MFVPPPSTPPGQKAGVGTTSTVMAPQETKMETDDPQAPAVHP